MNRRWAWIAVTLVGCGGNIAADPAADASLDAGDARDAVAEAPVTAAVACERRAVEVCKLLDTCDPLLRRWYVDRSECIASEGSTCLRDLDLPGVVDPIAQVEACAKSLQESTTCPAGPAVPLFCAPARPKGTLPDDAICLHDEQCAGGFCWNMYGGFDPELLQFPQCGRCRTRKAIGEACTFGSNQCDATSTSMRASGLACDRATSTCQLRPLEGERCTGAGDCDGTSCFDGRCGPPLVGPKIPAAHPSRFLAPGAECKDDDVGTRCGSGHYCKVPDPVNPGVCTAPLPPGERCSVGTECGHLHRCAKSPVDGKMRCLDVRAVCKA